MSIRVNIQGQIVTREEAKISVFDRQFLYGDGIYETMKTFGGRLFLAQPHLRRFRRSAIGIGLNLPWTDGDFTREMEHTIVEAGNDESFVRLMVTRGEGEFGLDPTGIEDPRFVIIVRPLGPVDPELGKNGVQLVVPSIRRTSPRALASHIKSGNYLNQAMALAEGKRKGAYEVIMLDEQGCVTEGSTSNLFFVRSGVIYTASIQAGVLPGVTRAMLLGLASRLGVRVERGHFPLEMLLTADEAFLSATIKEVLPVRKVDDQVIGASIPGPVTVQLMEAYQKIAAMARVGTLTPAETDALIDEGGGEQW